MGTKMNNITNNKKLRSIVKIIDYGFVIISLIADFLGIISSLLSLAPNLPQLNITTQLNWYAIAFIVMVNIALLLKLYSYQVRKRQDLGHKTELLVNGFDKISLAFENYYYDIYSKIEQANNTNELYSIVAEGGKSIVDQLESVLRKVTNNDVRACIKYFPQKYNTIDEMQLITLCRSDETLNDSRTEHQDFINVKENTDFEAIMKRECAVFAVIDLSSYKKRTGKEYKNSSADWQDRYNATIVHPITLRTKRERRKDYYNIIGFLCVDSLSLEAFAGDTGPLCIKFIQAASRLLYIYLDKCNIQKERIMASQTKKESEISKVAPVLVGAMSIE